MLRSSTESFTVITPLYPGGVTSSVKLIVTPYSTGVAKIYPTALSLLESVFTAEKDALERLRHPHILSLLSASSAGEYIIGEHSIPCRYLILEHCTGGDLQCLLAAQALNTEQIAKTLRQLSAALSFCHSSGLAHLSVRLEHILFDAKHNVKLASFGSCRALQDTAFSFKKSVKDHERYLAPECLRNEVREASAVDVFAAGVVLFIMCSGKFPFRRADATDPLYRLLVQDKNRFWAIHRVSGEFRELVEGMLATDPVQRLSIEQVRRVLGEDSV